MRPSSPCGRDEPAATIDASDIWHGNYRFDAANDRELSVGADDKGAS
jgi:hypothetical protein